MHNGGSPKPYTHQNKDCRDPGPGSTLWDYQLDSAQPIIVASLPKYSRSLNSIAESTNKMSRVNLHTSLEKVRTAMVGSQWSLQNERNGVHAVESLTIVIYDSSDNNDCDGQ